MRTQITILNTLALTAGEGALAQSFEHLRHGCIGEGGERRHRRRCRDLQSRRRAILRVRPLHRHSREDE
jgi:hypothetical protein